LGQTYNLGGTETLGIQAFLRYLMASLVSCSGLRFSCLELELKLFLVENHLSLRRDLFIYRVGSLKGTLPFNLEIMTSSFFALTINSFALDVPCFYFMGFSKPL